MSGRPPTHRVTPDDHGAWITVLATLLCSWMLCVYLTRIYIRLRYSPWGWDDTVISCGTFTAVCQVAAICEAVTLGLGKRGFLLSADQVDSIEKALFVSQTLYIVTLGISKCSTAILILRLGRAKIHRRATIAVITVTTLWSVVSSLVISLRGDLTHPWTAWDQNGSGLYPRWIGIEVSGMAIEFAIVALAVTLVCFLQMSFRLKFLVVGAFFTRILCIIPACVRLYYIRPSYNVSDPTFHNVYAAILTQVAMHYSLIAASIPCLKTFIKPFDTGYMSDTADDYASVSTSMFPQKRRSSAGANTGAGPRMKFQNSSSDSGGSKKKQGSSSGKAIAKAKQMLSQKSEHSDGGWSTKSSRMQNPGGELGFRPDVGEVRTEVVGFPHRRMTDDGQGVDLDKMVIRQTKEYEVHIEKADARFDML